MALKNLIASPGEAAAARITHRFRYSGSALEELHQAVVDAVDGAVAAEREACAKIVEGGSFLHDQAPAAVWARQVAALIRARNDYVRKARHARF